MPCVERKGEVQSSPCSKNGGVDSNETFSPLVRYVIDFRLFTRIAIRAWAEGRGTRKMRT